MAYADYMHCQGCDGKVLYLGDLDYPEGAVIWHKACLGKRGMPAALTAEALDAPTPRALKVIDAAEELGWTTGEITICVRLSKPDDKPDRVGAVARPVYATWKLRGWTPTGKPSWTFVSSGTAALQPLSESDLLAYLADPSLVMPEPPNEPPEGS